MQLDKAQLNPVLRDFWARPARNRVLYGGRASSKTWDAAGMAIYIADNVQTRFMCTRHFQNRIGDSVYTILAQRIKDFGLESRFKLTDNSIISRYTGTNFVFFGRARNAEEIKGTEGVGIHWAEECHLLTAEQWKDIDPTLRGEGSQHWLVFNPQHASDFVYKNFVANPPANTVVRRINYDENPFLSKTMLALIEECRVRDPDLYRHIYLGEPLDDSELVIIKRRWIEAAVDAHIKLGFDPVGDDRLGFDVADDGGDACALVHAHGSLAAWADEWRAGEDEILNSAIRGYNEADKRNALLVYDTIGVGAMVGSKCKEINIGTGKNVRFHAWNAGGKVINPDKDYMPGRKNKDHFCNAKAQAWFTIADRFRNTYDAVTNGTQYEVDQLISISSDLFKLEQLIFELSSPFRDYDSIGRLKVESKDDLKARGIQSPNLADAFIMAFAKTKSSVSFFGL